MRTNNYSANCHFCQKHVPARMGIWSYGETYCNDQCETDHYARYAERMKIVAEERRQLQINSFIPQWVAEANLKPATYEKVLLKASKGRTADLNEMTCEEVAKVLSDVSDRARAKEKKVKREALKADGKCTRCGGAGRSDKWCQTGYTCYECNGSGLAQPKVKV